MDIRNFCHVEKSSEDEVRAPVEKRPRTDLLDSDELSDLGALFKLKRMTLKIFLVNQKT